MTMNPPMPSTPLTVLGAQPAVSSPPGAVAPSPGVNTPGPASSTASTDRFSGAPLTSVGSPSAANDLLTIAVEGDASHGPFDPSTVTALHQGLRRAIKADDAANLGQARVMIASAVAHGREALSNSAAQLWDSPAPPLDAVSGWAIGLGSSGSGLTGAPMPPEAGSQIATAVQTAQGDPNDAVMHGLRAGYQLACEDLADYACEVDHYNTVKRGIRDELSRAREALADLAGLPEDAAISPPFDSQDLDATYYGTTRDTGGRWSEGEPITTKAELEAYIEGLEDQLETVGEDSQLAMLDLEQAMQRQQQWLEMMSAMSKMAHDTAMAIINNMKV